ncbi:DNA cytosine methyltransferase [Streptomyces californicus]|uniref:DNA cytosine methyltransferase n=1 Tax=Streptomyces californicus TaxID=67351 RepID=UPI00099D8A98|nr:DNA cytosine methyltransferase [Streptomyces californicus]QRV58848.1 DNA cytosine methyltransferase [Streptomyces californicus]
MDRLHQARRLLDRPPTPVLTGQLTAPVPGLRIGSVCSGYRGLDMAVEEVFGGTTAWVSDIDPGANQILAHHWPEVPNLGDLKEVDWAAVEPVDIFCGGYPCQPFSSAGLRKGTDDERHIWPWIARALGVLRPRIAIFENVAGHLRRGFDVVLADLAHLGFDAEWCTVRASEVDAPHQRNRLFLLAVAADAADLGHERARGARGRGYGPTDHRVAAADTGRPGLEVRRVEPHRNERQATERGGGERDWGRFATAVARWEQSLGRRAPSPVDALGRLSPAFTEWLMGLPAGHVTQVPGLTRNQQLHALGNGVVPQQATHALRILLDRHTAHTLPTAA